ncbi:MAG: competence/damage-inducible protein A [Ignavibacteriales bacterium]|nr:competence/damage-inducible protein A [Ignavibacteriales bacterium]
MKAEIISIGDELLIGQVVNTNQAYIAEKLNGVGIVVDRMTTVGDDEPSILQTFESAVTTHDVVVVTGGLGPTHDDITRTAVCTFFKTDLILNEEALKNVREIFTRRNLPITKLNEEQALVPRGSTVMQNRFGTAPGHFFENEKKFFIVMPGVPAEMKGMMEGFVIPYFEKKPSGMFVRHRTLKTTGIAESHLAEQIGDVHLLFEPDSGTTLAFLPSPLGVRLRVTVRGKNLALVEETIRQVEMKLRSKAQKYIYAADDEDLEHVVGRLLAERKMTIAVAESCTGGLIADRITDVAGSSSYFERAMTAYSNESKIAELGIPVFFIEKFGAVSREVAEAMAFGVRKKSNTDIGLSTTGIAGPTGGSAEKPVGLVWIGYSDKNETIALRFNFLNDRRRVKERTAQAALEIVRRKLLKIV